MDLVTVLISVFSSGLVASVITEILKQPLIPIAFEKFPRVTAYAVSVISSIVVLVNQGYTWNGLTENWWTTLSVGSVAFLIAVYAYDNVTKKDSGASATRF